MGKQSSRLYYNGKDHKDIYYNGKYHNAMYFKDQGGIIWRKIIESENESYCALITNKPQDSSQQYPDSYWGINALYPEQRVLDAKIVKQYNYYYESGQSAPKKIRVGDNFAVSYMDAPDSPKNNAWVTTDGKYWKKLELTASVKEVFVCDTGFIYYSTDKRYFGVVLDKDYNIESENLILESYNFLTERFYDLEYHSTNGVWIKKSDSELGFLTLSGTMLSMEISIADEPSYSVDFTFTGNGKNYIVVDANTYFEEINSSFPIQKIYACDGYFLNEVVEEASGTLFNSSQNRGIVEYEGNFYIYNYYEPFQQEKRRLEILKTSDLVNYETYVTWYEDEYIELDVLGGTINNYVGVRFYPVQGETDYSAINYIIQDDGKVMVKLVHTKLNTAEVAFFQNEQIKDVKTHIIDAGALQACITSKLLEKDIKGFCYFTDNIGVGVSYP